MVENDVDVIFVVDDEKVHRAIIAALVKKLGFQCLEFETGYEALAAYKEAVSSGSPVAAIIMDIEMPCMSGLEAAWRIRALEARQRHLCSCQDAVVPSIALTSQSRPGQHTTQKFLTGSSSARGNDQDAEECCQLCKTLHTPIWAVSASSLEDQARSPAMNLISSSYSGPPWKLAGFDAFVPKPLQPIQLVSMLNSAKRQGSANLSLDLQSEKHKQLCLSESATNNMTQNLCKMDACAKLPAGHQLQETVVDMCSGDSSLTQICTQAS